MRWLSCSVSIFLPSDPSQTNYPDEPFVELFQYMLGNFCKSPLTVELFSQDVTFPKMSLDSDKFLSLLIPCTSVKLYFALFSGICKNFRLHLMIGPSFHLSPAGHNHKYSLSRRLKIERQWVTYGEVAVPTVWEPSTTPAPAMCLEYLGSTFELPGEERLELDKWHKEIGREKDSRTCSGKGATVCVVQTSVSSVLQ